MQLGLLSRKEVNVKYATLVGIFLSEDDKERIRRTFFMNYLMDSYNVSLRWFRFNRYKLYIQNR